MIWLWDQMGQVSIPYSSMSISTQKKPFSYKSYCKLLSAYSHNRNRSIALPGPLKWSATGLYLSGGGQRGWNPLAHNSSPPPPIKISQIQPWSAIFQSCIVVCVRNAVGRNRIQLSPTSVLIDLCRIFEYLDTWLDYAINRSTDPEVISSRE